MTRLRLHHKTPVVVVHEAQTWSSSLRARYLYLRRDNSVIIRTSSQSSSRHRYVLRGDSDAGPMDAAALTLEGRLLSTARFQCRRSATVHEAGIRMSRGLFMINEAIRIADNGGGKCLFARLALRGRPRESRVLDRFQVSTGILHGLLDTSCPLDVYQRFFNFDNHVYV